MIVLKLLNCFINSCTAGPIEVGLNQVTTLFYWKNWTHLNHKILFFPFMEVWVFLFIYIGECFALHSCWLTPLHLDVNNSPLIRSLFSHKSAKLSQNPEPGLHGAPRGCWCVHPIGKQSQGKPTASPPSPLLWHWASRALETRPRSASYRRDQPTEAGAKPAGEIQIPSQSLQ